MTYIPNLAIKLKALRLLRGMLQSELCDQIGISRPLLVAIEQGRAIPTQDQIEKIENALGIEFNAETERAFTVLAPELAQEAA